MRREFICFMALLLCLVPTGGALADEIRLQNGDRLSGEIVSMQEGAITLQTSYAGRVQVQWGEVEVVLSDEPLRVELTDGSVIKGIAGPAGEGRLGLETESMQEDVVVPFSRVASINVDPEAQPAVRLKARANVGVSVSRGNTETESYHGDAELVARTEENRYTVGLEYDREEDGEEVTANSYLGYAKYDHFFTKKLYGYANALFEKDEFKDLRLRSTAGLGAGYQFLETEKTNLSLEAGLSYVNTDYEEAEDKATTAGRWAVSFDRYFFEKRLQFFHFHEGFAGLEDTDTLFIRSRTGFRMPIAGGFTATAQYNLDWDNSPAPGDEKEDMKYIFSLGYQFE